MPNLIIVDGGKEQVKTIQKILKKFSLNTVVIGLVKDKNHRTDKIVNYDHQEIEFKNKQRIYDFLTNCQNEVHLYAINLHRKLRQRSTLK